MLSNLRDLLLCYQSRGAEAEHRWRYGLASFDWEVSRRSLGAQCESPG
jgi:hypothetical protein